MKNYYYCEVHDQGRDSWAVGQPWPLPLRVLAGCAEDALRTALGRAVRDAERSGEYCAGASIHVRVVDAMGNEVALGSRTVPSRSWAQEERDWHTRAENAHAPEEEEEEEEGEE